MDRARSVICEVMNNCVLGERKNMNLPGAIVDLPTLTEKVSVKCNRRTVRRGGSWNVQVC